MFHTYHILALAGAYLPLASASVFPTEPVQATVWSADRPTLVSWVEDWKFPLLSEMGPMEISLWCHTDTYVASLASGVDPTTKATRVTVPGWALRQGTLYTLRFTTSKPIDTVVYSADFAIVPANTTSWTVAGTGTGSGAPALAMQSGTASGNGTEAGSGFKTVPTSTSTGSLFSWTTTTTSTSGQFGSTTPSGIPPPSGTLPGGGLSGQRAASAAQRGVDVEKLKFQFVFVIWPVLMGITMAL